MFGIKNIKLVAAIKTVGIITAMAVCGILGVGIVEVFGVTAAESAIGLALVILLGLLINMVYHSYLYQLEEEQRKQNING
jgi:hypothetical protein